MSVATTASAATAPLTVKKSRATAAAKKDASKAPRAKKPATDTAKNGSKSTSPTRPQSGSGGAAPKAKGDDLASITSGIKKITLVTGKQKQTRTRENKKPTGGKNPASSAGSHTPSLPVTPVDELQQELGRSSNDNGVLAAGVPLVQKETPQPEQGLPIIPLVDATVTGGKAVEPEAPNQLPIVEQPGPSDVFVEYRPDGPKPETITPQGPLKWLPVNNMDTPSPHKQPATTPSPVQEEARAVISPSPMKRNEMPIFTPTSQLRFAPRTDEHQEQEQQQQSSTLYTPPKAKTEAGRMWEVPESPDPLA